MSLPTAAVDEARRMLEANDAENDRTIEGLIADRESPVRAGSGSADRDPDLADISANNLQDPQGAGAPVWQTESVSDLAANLPDPATFLIRRLWPADAYGVISAEAKAGKTWITLDIGVSIAAGVATHDGIEVDRPGPVLVFLGEGGRRNAWRRVRAICEAKGIDPAELTDLHLSYRAPNLSDAKQALAILEAIEAIRPVLVIIDPLYLSAAGANGSSLYDMANVLHDIQIVAEHHRCALIVVHHWNQTGKGSGFGRMSGAGPEEWGRVLWSVEVNDRGVSEHPEGSLVRLTVKVRGGEIPDAAFTLTREVWTDDPDDLNAPMHYRLHRGETVAGDTTKPSTAQDRIRAVLADGDWMTPHIIQDEDAMTALETPGMHPLKMDTVTKKARTMHESGELDRRPCGQTFEYRLAQHG